MGWILQEVGYAFVQGQQNVPLRSCHLKQCRISHAAKSFIEDRFGVMTERAKGPWQIQWEDFRRA